MLLLVCHGQLAGQLACGTVVYWVRRFLVYIDCPWVPFEWQSLRAGLLLLGI